MRHVLIEGDPLDPQSGDLIAQLDTLDVGKPVPDGWRVMSGNAISSQIARVVMRYEAEEDIINHALADKISEGEIITDVSVLLEGFENE